MRALNTPAIVKMLIDSATNGNTQKTAVQGCLSVLVRLIEWHAQNLQSEADAALSTVDDIGSDLEDAAEAETPKAVALKKPSTAFEQDVDRGSASEAAVPLPLLVAEVLRQMPRLVGELLSNRVGMPARRFSNGNARVPFGLVRLQAVELLTHMVYVRHPDVALCMREHRVLLKCLDLAIEYELNNVLHSVVLQSIISMCEEFDLATTVDDYRALFDGSSSGVDKNLVDTILDAYEHSDVLKAARGYQCCYLGHLHIMANAVHDASIKAAQIMEANPGSMELFQKEQTGDAAGEEKAVEAVVSSLKPPPPPSGDEAAAVAQRRRSSEASTTRAVPADEYSTSALEVAALIVTACASNARWRSFVDTRLLEVNKRQRESPLGGEDAERASSLASPRVTGIQLSDVLENSDPDRIESLDLGLALNDNQLDSLRDMEPYDLNADGSTSSSDDDDDDEGEMDPKKLAELQERYGFSTDPSSSSDNEPISTPSGHDNPQNDGTSDTVPGANPVNGEDDEWGFAAGDGMFEKDDDEGGVNLGGDGDDDWGFATEASKEEDESPGAPQAAAPAPPPLPE
jgi:hypothetical protein